MFVLSSKLYSSILLKRPNAIALRNRGKNGFDENVGLIWALFRPTEKILDWIPSFSNY